MKKVISIIVTMALLCAMLAGCAQKVSVEAETPAPAPSVEAEVPEEAETTAPEAQKTKAILVTSFGTSYNDTRDATIGAIEEVVTQAFPEYDVRRAFTAQTIIDILKEREGLEIDNVEQAMDKLVADKMTEVIVLPTHLMNGLEYDDIVSDVNKYADKFETLTIAAPLLTSEEDYTAVADAIIKDTAEYDGEKTAVVFMGHGTEHRANAVYPYLQQKLNDAGKTNYFIGTVEAEPNVEDVMESMKDGGYEKVVLLPLMVVAGDHATNDMAGDEEDSWKSIFTAAGYEVTPVLKGLGEYADIQTIYAQHAQDAIDGKTSSNVAISTKLADGTYPIAVESSSNMFKVTDAQLVVSGDKMSAVLTLSGTGYEKLFVGTSEEADKASDDAFAYFKEDADGAYTYEIPVAELDKETDVAAFSIKKEKWYDRTLVFDSASLPSEAFM